MSDDESENDEVRGADEVARRALALFGVWSLTTNASRSDVLQWLADNNLFIDLSPREAAFVDTATPTRKQIIDASWYSERLIMLLWALRLVQLPPANEQCDARRFQECIPPFAPGTVADFITRSELRPEEDLLEMAETCEELHWEARDARINGRAPRLPVDMEIIQERHHAINWVIGYCHLPWDQVTTDT